MFQQRMSLAAGGNAAGVRKLPMTADNRHMPAAGPNTHPAWTQGNVFIVAVLLTVVGSDVVIARVNRTPRSALVLCPWSRSVSWSLDEMKISAVLWLRKKTYFFIGLHRIRYPVPVPAEIQPLFDIRPRPDLTAGYEARFMQMFQALK